MDGNLAKLEEDFKEILIKQSILSSKEIQLIEQKQLDYGMGFLETLIKEEIFTNEELIKLLHLNCSFPLITAPDSRFEIINHSQFENYIRNGYFIYKDVNAESVIALNNLLFIPNLLGVKNDSKNQIRLIQKKDFYFLLEQNFSKLNTLISINFLEFISEKLTARNINYKNCLLVFLFFFMTIIFGVPTLFHLVSNFCYFSQNVFKLLLFKKALQKPGAIVREERKITHYPIYSLLVPLYKEETLVEKILHSISQLNYPKDKLDVKIIIEEDDGGVNQVIDKIELPSYVHVIKVPFSLPRTKPKALNYAIQYATGKYLVIYDAEDRPHPDQLLDALKTFEKLPEEYACLQAKLNFYNKEENLLAKLFSIEYYFWFSYMLKGLSRLNLPLTLGGTSNHFKTSILRKVGLWDAFNVTEDADLGLRLYLQGYKVYMLDSLTLEESPLDILNWINQRARWIKGFIQTFIVFIRQELSFEKLSLPQYFSVFIFVGMSAYNFFCLPWVILFITFNKNEVLNSLWFINSIFAFIYLYTIAAYILMKEKGNKKRFHFLDWVALILWPFYFVLHTFACYKALWEICIAPFRWNKTRHGISKQG